MAEIKGKFLKSEVIKTMKKDTARAQRGEAPKEFELRPEKEILEIELKEGERLEELRKRKPAIDKEPKIEERKKISKEEYKREEKMKKAEKRAREDGQRREEEQKQKEEEEKKREKERQIIEAEERRKEEERRMARVEEERRKREPEIRKKKLAEEKMEIGRALAGLAVEKRPLENQKAEVLKKLGEIEKNFNNIAEKEQKVEEEEELIEEKEKQATDPRKKKRIEKERWKIGDKRKELEKKRWPWGEKLKEAEEQIKDIEEESLKIEAKKEELIKKQEEILREENQFQFEKERKELEKELQDLRQLRESWKIKKSDFPVQLGKVEEELETILDEERRIEKSKKVIEEEERTVKELEERRRLEKERWEVEEKRRKIEEKRWEKEEEKQRLEAISKGVETRLENLVKKEEDINRRLEEIARPEKIVVERKIREEEERKKREDEERKRKEKTTIKEKRKPEEEKKGVSTLAPAKAITGEKVTAGEEEKRRIQEARRRIEALKKKTEEETARGRKENVTHPETAREEENIEEKKELKKRISLEREREQKSREMRIKADERRKKLLERIRGEQKEIKIKKPSTPVPLSPEIRIVPKKPTIREKIWVRILIFSLVLIFLAAIGTFWYWYTVIRKQPPSPQPPFTIECTIDAGCPEDYICNPQGVCEIIPVIKCTSDNGCPEDYICNPQGVCEKEVEISSSLFLVENTRILTISTPEEIRLLLKQILQEWQSPGTFRRIAIKKDNKFLNLKEFFEALQIRTSENFYQKLGDNFTLFIYSQIEGNRIGFATDILDKNGLSNLLTSQETTLKDDFKTFFTLTEEESNFTPYPYFRNANQVGGYTGPNFRFQTLTKQDLGICYLVSDYYFVFTGSWKSMEKTVEALVITGAPIEITKDLKIGSRGYEVELLQAWLKQDRDVYPQGRVTGYFGNLSKQAVTLFQEKYASDVLTPQGLSKGTGEVDFYTRIKLNELYGRSGIIPSIREITVDLRYGDHGNEVRLLQTWLVKDKRVYPEAIISGWFGYLTQQAVIRFQEKYKGEILDPQGLTRGTGIVDVLTRTKLNKLYGQ